MLHFINEGEIPHVGLNIRHGWPWVAFIWCWYDPATYTASSLYFRIRLHRWPIVIFSRNKWNIVDEYLFSRTM